MLKNHKLSKDTAVFLILTDLERFSSFRTINPTTICIQYVWKKLQGCCLNVDEEKKKDDVDAKGNVHFSPALLLGMRSLFLKALYSVNKNDSSRGYCLNSSMQ